MNKKRITKTKIMSDLQDLKTAFIAHCKELGCDEDYIKVCENKFVAIEYELNRLAIFDGHIEETCNKFQALEMLKDELDFYFDGQKQTISISKSHNLVCGARLSVNVDDKDKFELLRKVLG